MSAAAIEFVDVPVSYRRLEYVWAADVDPILVAWCLVKGVISAGSLVVIFGESNSGKTFFVLDMALAIASKREWCGHRTAGGLVVYIAGEGQQGIRNRVSANLQRGLITKAIPFAIITRAADLLSPAGDIEDLIKLIREAESACGETCTLIVIDTLARAMPGGNENEAADMGGLIATADRLRHEIKATCIFIHHAGKDASKGARGHSSLRAAVDTEILVEGTDGARTATVVKQRDLPSGEVFPFELEQVVLGHDEDGDPVSSCIVKHQTGASAPRKQPAGKWQKALLRALEARQRDGGESIWTIADLRTVAKTLGAGKSSAYDAADWLAASPFMTATVGGMKLSYEP